MKFKIIFIYLLFSVSSCVVKTAVVDPRISFLDSAWGIDLKLSNVLEIVNKSGFMQVQVVGFNVSPTYQKFQYRIRWYDKNGLEVPSVINRWVDVPAFGNSPFNFQAIAPNEDSINFQILIRK